MKRLFLTLSIVLSLLMSCHKNEGYKDKLKVDYRNQEPEELVIKDYSKALFSLDTNNFEDELKSIQNDFPIFLNGDIDNPEAVEYLRAFVTDTFCISLNKMSERRFDDMKSLSDDIKSVYQHLHYYYPDIEIPQTYLYVSGIDYSMPSVVLQPQAVLIAADFYLGNEDMVYDYVGMPRFRSVRCQPYYITRDLAQAFYQEYISRDNIQKDVLNEMIKAGKRLFFIEAMCPSLPDSVLMGYSSKQMSWVEQFESDVWTSIVGNNMLYDKNLMTFRTFFGDAPFTQAFSKEAPARLGEYIGLQIIRSYMTNNDVSVQELMNNNDVQQIFQASQYKPKD